MKIAILDGFLVNPGDISWDPIAKQGELTVHASTAPAETVAHIGDAEVVYTNRCVIGAAESALICKTLQEILADIEDGRGKFSVRSEQGLI